MNSTFHNKTEYSFAISRIDAVDDDCFSKEKKIILLKDFIRILHLDIQYQNISRYFTEEHSEISYVYIPDYYIKDGNKVYIKSSKKTKKLKLNETCVLSTINDLKSMSNIKENEKFRMNSGEHRQADFYEGIDICVVIEGKHHAVNSLIYHTGGVIEAQIVDCREMFDYIYTDGEYWYNIDGTKNGKVKDFRIAVLFYACKKLKDLEK